MTWALPGGVPRRPEHSLAAWLKSSEWLEHSLPGRDSSHQRDQSTPWRRDQVIRVTRALPGGVTKSQMTWSRRQGVLKSLRWLGTPLAACSSHQMTRALPGAWSSHSDDQSTPWRRDQVSDDQSTPPGSAQAQMTRALPGGVTLVTQRWLEHSPGRVKSQRWQEHSQGVTKSSEDQSTLVSDDLVTPPGTSHSDDLVTPPGSALVSLMTWSRRQGVL